MNEEELKLLEKIETLPKELNMEIRGLILANVCLREENKQLKEQIEYLRRSIERKESTITELEQEKVPYTNEYVEKLEKARNEVIKNVESLDLKIYPKEFYELINILDIDKGE